MESTEEKLVNEVSKTREGNETKKIDISAEERLKTIADIVLVVGIIATVILSFSIVYVDSGKYQYITDNVFSSTGFVITLVVLFSTLISWTFLKVFADISINLKEINSKM